MGRHAIKREMDLQILLEWIADGARVLDLGCGRGILLEELIARKHCYAVGIDSDLAKITSCVKRSVPAYQGDLCDMLPVYDDNSFDWVVCSRTLQELSNPQQVLREALRVGKRLAIGFVNHGYWLNRWHMLKDGSRVKNDVYPDPWWASRAMNPVSISGFEDFCRAENAVIEHRVFLAEDWRTPCKFLPGWFAGYAVYELRQGAVQEVKV
ncbi:methionine biosynthesis protein MetW [Cerasicoccus arenae]|uniref:Methyltransferase n=1 Tax=Cerasicoccus arenae TaxID=424488 RepID=A0A8J3DDJ0_9BACT|nr:methionine biosynthesis protein MetW [Cerasicoccus arenae]MBK1858739.1 methyltransferase domain-containing protein [Cerasicoccus arenae]GHC07235.1 methyltransferase [Cerasicoccus arenae]